MLRSSKCILSGIHGDEFAERQECPLDPGGYFIVNGTEKVILVQEQLSKNRVIVETDSKKDIVQASVTSSTHERKSKSYVLTKHARIYLKHNSFHEDIPIAIAFKAMGIQADREILQLVAGNDEAYKELFAINLEEAARLKVFTRQQALTYVGQRVKSMRRQGAARRPVTEEALEALANLVMAHVEVENLNFRPKAMYVAVMVRRVLMCMQDPGMVDDRDYVGNKRLELAGQMLSLLFEDFFKKFTYDFKLRMDKVLKKPNRTAEFDAYDHIQTHGNHITMGMERAIATGRILPGALAVLAAAVTLSSAPTGLMCVAALVTGLLPFLRIMAKRATLLGWLPLLLPTIAAGVVVLVLFFVSWLLRLNAVDVKKGEALLGFGNLRFMGVEGGGFARDLPAGQCMNLSEQGDLTEAAANLFSMLHMLDQGGFQAIASDPGNTSPDGQVWGTNMGITRNTLTAWRKQTGGS